MLAELQHMVHFSDAGWSLLLLGGTAFVLGMRHGLDADHIVAIDNVTRKLIMENKGSKLTGTFFALGHSTIVFMLTLALIIGVYSVKDNISLLQDYGEIIGTIIATLFMWITVFMNVITLRQIVVNKQLETVATVGVMTFFGNKLLKVGSAHKMYFVGLFFGLGFDTATEVSLLSAAALAVLQGMQVWIVLLLPLLFAAGMMLIDTLDCLLMNSIFMWASEQKKMRFYNLAVFSVATFSAIILGIVGLVNLFKQQFVWQNMLTMFSDFLDVHSEGVGIGIAVVFMSIVLMGKLRNNLRFKNIGES